jgi:tetratricopeptide (TPR) repeat protein
MRRRSSIPVAIALLFALGARAGADVPGAAAARAAHRRLVHVESDRPPAGHEPEGEQGKPIHHLPWGERHQSALEAFRRAFAAADWVGWPATPEDAPVLERGLLDVGEAALARRDGATAVKAYDRAATLPALSENAVDRVNRGRVAAHLADGFPDKARAIAADAATKAPKEWRPAALARQGDLEWALGRVEEARGFYVQASKSAPEGEAVVFGAEAVAAREAAWKLRLLGRPFGALAPEWIVGSDAVKLKEVLAGRGVVLVFPDPYTPTSPDVVPYANLAASGTIVVGVLSPLATRRLPEVYLDDPVGSVPRLRGEPQPSGPAGWAERFRRLAKVEFPFVGLPAASLPIGKAVLGSALVLDREGTVAYFAGPGEPVAYVAAVVERLRSPR